MVRNKTLINIATQTAVLAYAKGHQQAEKHAVVTLIPPLIEPLRYLCKKYEDCPDQAVYCHRSSAEPCCFRKENPRITEFIATVNKILMA